MQWDELIITFVFQMVYNAFLYHFYFMQALCILFSVCHPITEANLTFVSSK